MNSLNATLDNIKQKLSKVPEDKLVELEDFVDFLLVKSKRPTPKIVKMEGIWDGLGFEKIQDLDADIKKMREEMSKGILKKAL